MTMTSSHPANLQAPYPTMTSSSTPSDNTASHAILLEKPGLWNHSLGWDPVVRGALNIIASTTIGIVALIILFLLWESLGFFKTNTLSSLLLDARWLPVSSQQEHFGIQPLLMGTLLVTVIAGIIAVPVSLFSAIYLSELSTPLENKILKPLIELLATLPSVVIGFFGLVVVVPWIKETFHLASGMTALTGGLLLALMAIPTMVTISEDALKSVPRAYRDGALALGSTPFTTAWKVVLPPALPGILAAMLLGIGRIFSETMTVMMVTGNAALMTANPLDSVRTMTATIAAEMGEVVFGSPQYHALFCIGFILLCVTLVLNTVARTTLRRFMTRKSR